MNAASKNNNCRQIGFCDTFDSRAFATTGAIDEASPVTTGASEEVSEAKSIAETVNFYGRDFIVTKDVLIPRPETEQLIDMVLNLAGKPYLTGVKPSPRELPEHLIILDVGTGTGCIAITLKKELPEATIYATDISEPALKIAQKNAAKHDAHITTIISYLLEKVNDSTLPIPDLVVANLPYVDETWPWLDKKSLSKEPSIALYADGHGLALIKELIIQASALHIKYLILEADPCEHVEITKFAEKNKYKLLKKMGYILCLKKAL